MPLAPKYHIKPPIGVATPPTPMIMVPQSNLFRYESREVLLVTSVTAVKYITIPTTESAIPPKQTPIPAFLCLTIRA
jgi:hypothetical protein